MFTTNKNDQFSLNLQKKFIHDKNDFLISKCNENAFSFIDNWPSWKNRKLIIIGDRGSGKTHLSRIWQKKTKAIFLDINDYKKKSLKSLFTKNKNFIIDNVHSKIKEFTNDERPEVEKYLLHFYNLIEENKGYLILTDSIVPKFWNIQLPDLKSRIMSSFCILINQPDDDFLSLLLVKLFSDKQILIDKKIIKFIVSRSERSFSNLQLIVDKINKESLSTKQRINLNFVKKLI